LIRDYLLHTGPQLGRKQEQIIGSSAAGFKMSHCNSFIHRFNSVLLILLGLVLLTNAKNTILPPHDMRMEDFKIRRSEWNKEDLEYVLKFARSGDVIRVEDVSLEGIRYNRIIRDGKGANSIKNSRKKSQESVMKLKHIGGKKGTDFGRNKRALESDVCGKWHQSPSGRVTFSVMEEGVKERYSAEVGFILALTPTTDETAYTE
jgi:hypothetical protein